MHIAKSLLVSLCLVLLGLLLANTQVAYGAQKDSGGKRLALVIGNDNYQKVRTLEKAGNDAVTMARELRSAGFEVFLYRDLNYLDMVRAIESFSGRINGGDQVAVFFAGHGVQIKTGSYLLPVDIEANSEGQVEKTAYGVADLTDKLSEAKASFALVMVDACRDNPLKGNGRAIGNSRGLSAIEPPKGQMVVYSASKGQQALDRLSPSDKDPNGVFTREFIKRMKQPGVRIEELVREVQDSVETLAQSISHEQRPAIYNEARGNFYFYGPTTMQVGASAAAALPTQAKSAEQIEDELWAAIKDSGEVSSFEEYLSQYAKGRYLAQARIALNKARRAAIGSTAAAAPAVPAPAPASVDAETAFWNEVKANSSREYTEAYLKRYPKGKYLALAKLELRKIDERQQAERESLVAQRQQEEQKAWEAARTAGTDASYAAYLANYPQGSFGALALAAQMKLKRDEAEAWSRAEAASDSAPVQAYLRLYPGGRHVAQAQTRLETLKNAGKPAIAFAKFEGESESSTAIVPILKHDLGQGGQFRLIDAGDAVMNHSARPVLADWRARGAQYLVTGSISKLADGRFNLSARVWNVGTGQGLGGQTMDVSAADMRLAAHGMSDYIYKKITGTPGNFSRRIAQVEKIGLAYLLMISDSDGANAQSAISSSKLIGLPVWSTSTKQVAYISFESGRPAAYVHELSSGRRKLTGVADASFISACKPEFDQLQLGSFGPNNLLAREEWIQATSEECRTTMLALFGN
jgi:uncharacterized caspase-like protein